MSADAFMDLFMTPTPTPFPLEETDPVQEFKLWHIYLVVLAGIIMMVCFLIAIVLVCKRRKRSKPFHFVYETKPAKKRKASSFSVRSQGIMELNSPNPLHQDYVNVWDKSGSQLLETNNLAPVQTPSEPDLAGGEPEQEDANPDVAYEEDSDEGEIGNFNRNSVIRQSIRSDSGRNVHLARQSESRRSVRSESGVRVQHDATEGDGQGSLRTKGSMKKTKAAVFSLPINNDNEDFHNSDSGMQPLSIHQVQTPKQAHTEGGASPHNPFMSALGVVPGFKDPEILGGSTDSLERLRINLPPDIYSSQILTTVRTPEPEPEQECEPRAEEEIENEFFESGPMIVMEMKKSTQSLDRYMSLEPRNLDPLADDDDRHYMQIREDKHSDPAPADTECTASADTEHPVSADMDDPQYMKINIFTNEEQEDSEAVYDQPQLVLPASAQLSTPLFDDPGYDRGLQGLASLLSPPVTSDRKRFDLSEQLPVQEEAGGHDGTGGDGDRKEDIIKNSDSFILSYVEEELQELDADIAACLAQDPV